MTGRLHLSRGWGSSQPHCSPLGTYCPINKQQARAFPTGPPCWAQPHLKADSTCGAVPSCPPVPALPSFEARLRTPPSGERTLAAAFLSRAPTAPAHSLPRTSGHCTVACVHLSEGRGGPGGPTLFSTPSDLPSLGQSTQQSLSVTPGALTLKPSRHRHSRGVSQQQSRARTLGGGRSGRTYSLLPHFYLGSRKNLSC